ncbi:PQQ-binding-like beta-propeller repeat protein [Saccharomonospora sp. NPDC006951]
MGFKRGWLWLIPVVVVVVAAAVLVPTVLLGSDEAEGSGSSGEATLAVKLERPETEDAINAWPVGDTLVVATESKIAAYARADGAERWSVTPPDGAELFCSTSSRVVDGRIALVYGTGPFGTSYETDCREAAVLNVESGELGWRKPFDAPQRVSPEDNRDGAGMEIVEGTVVIAQDQGLVGLDAASGDEKWSRDVQHQQGESLGCGAEDLLANETEVFLAQHCRDLEHAVTFVSLDPATGEVAREKLYEADEILERPEFVDLVSVDPLIAAIDGGNRSFYAVFDGDLNPMSTILIGEPEATGSLDIDGQAFDRMGDVQHVEYRFLSTEDTLYTVTTVEDDEANELKAFDLTTGQERWSATADQTRLLAPVALEGEQLVVAGASTDDEGDMHVLRVNVADGAVASTESRTVHRDSGLSPLAEQFRYFWEDGTMYAVRGRSSGTSDFDLFAYGA